MESHVNTKFFLLKFPMQLQEKNNYTLPVTSMLAIKASTLQTLRF